MSIIYNVTSKVDGAIAENWLKWLLDEHIPEIMATGCFINYQVVRLLETDDSEGPTYAVQYKASSKAEYNRYIEIYSSGLRKKASEKWGNGFITFRSLLEVVK